MKIQKIRKNYAAAFIMSMMICLLFTPPTVKANDLPEEAPIFHANVEWSPQGYIVKGTFTEFPSDIYSAETLYSLDGETYLASGQEWNITKWSDGPWTDWDEENLEKFQNQTCLYSNEEPMKSYLAGELDRFYVKLRLTRENGISYDTQAAVIDRGQPMPVPEEISSVASFAPSICVRTYRPFSYYGRYQITVKEDATPEEIAASLPKTLPIKVDLQKGIDHVADGIIDCPVTWKPLADLTLTTGESVIIPDAAEEIVVPGGTMLNTPLGIFELSEPLGINQYGLTDEVRIVLNVISKDSNPTGALSCDFNGLSMAFHQKPTGATAIRAYTLSEGDTEWTELPNLPLLEAVNAQPSTPGSGYTYVLDNTHELYQSYMSADAEGREPTPFYIGIKIEGGVYDGKELILPWPDTYDIPLELPKLGGSGGNEDNAGTDNKGDGTSEGQRPNLPNSGDNDENGDNEDIDRKDDDTYEEQKPNLPNPGDNDENEGGSGSDHKDDGTSEGQKPTLPNSGNSGKDESNSSSGHKGSSASGGQRPSLTQNSREKNTTSSGRTSGHIDSQSQGNSYIADESLPPMAAQTAEGTVTEAKYPDTDSSVNAGTNTRTENQTLTPRSIQDRESAVPVSSDKEGKITATPSSQNGKSVLSVLSDEEDSSDPHTENSGRRFILMILTTILTGLCIIGYLYYRSYCQAKRKL